MHVLGLIIVLLLIRQIYIVATVNRVPHEAVWYPLAALTELLAVFLFAVSGLVPNKKDVLDARQGQFGKNHESNAMV